MSPQGRSGPRTSGLRRSRRDTGNKPRWVSEGVTMAPRPPGRICLQRAQRLAAVKISRQCQLYSTPHDGLAGRHSAFGKAAPKPRFPRLCAALNSDDSAGEHGLGHSLFRVIRLRCTVNGASLFACYQPCRSSISASISCLLKLVQLFSKVIILLRNSTRSRLAHKCSEAVGHHGRATAPSEAGRLSGLQAQQDQV